MKFCDMTSLLREPECLGLACERRWAPKGSCGYSDPKKPPKTKSESLKDRPRKPRQSIALKLQRPELAEALPAIEEALGQCGEPIATEL